MRGWVEELMEEKVALQVAPLIDVVFLLLIYFMVTSSLRREEADLGISLPGAVIQAEVVQMPDEQIIEIAEDGLVVLNNRTYGTAGDGKLGELVATLSRYRVASDRTGAKALVTIQAAEETVHQRVVDVMNVCKGAGIKHISFGMSE